MSSSLHKQLSHLPSVRATPSQCWQWPLTEGTLASWKASSPPPTPGWTECAGSSSKQWSTIRNRWLENHCNILKFWIRIYFQWPSTYKALYPGLPCSTRSRWLLVYTNIQRECTMYRVEPRSGHETTYWGLRRIYVHPQLLTKMIESYLQSQTHSLYLKFSAVPNSYPIAGRLSFSISFIVCFWLSIYNYRMSIIILPQELLFLP